VQVVRQLDCMNAGLTKQEQAAYQIALEEVEFHRLLINALRPAQGTFHNCGLRFNQYLEALVKTLELYEREVRQYEKRLG